MPKFLLFAGSYYYPNGGWNDFIGEFDSQEDAIKAYLAHNEDAGAYDYDWAHVVYDGIKVWDNWDQDDRG